MKSDYSDHVKYEKLSYEIKNEISKYHKEMCEIENKELNIEEIMHEWFESKFDNWLYQRIESDNNRRKHYRLEVEIPINIFETLIESSDDTEAKDFLGQVVNISKGGLYFLCDIPITISSIIKVKIDLSGIEKDLKEIEALAMVIRSEKVDNDKYGIGLVFSSIYDDNKSNLEIFILKNLANHIYTP